MSKFLIEGRFKENYKPYRDVVMTEDIFEAFNILINQFDAHEFEKVSIEKIGGE